MSAIPIIDLGFTSLHGDSMGKEKGEELYRAFRDTGFAYVKGHGMPEALIHEAFEWSRKFFSLPQSAKDKVPHPTEGWYHRGYSAIGLEKVSQMLFDEGDIAERRKVPDMKESYDIGKEDDKEMPNIWPEVDDIPGFREFFVRFYDVCYEVEVKLLKAVALGMGLPESYFTEFHQEKENQIRLLRYPPISIDLLESGKAECIGAHSDFGTLTLLFQDNVGGLMVEDSSNEGSFVEAPYIPNTIVVNVGDFLMRWSNDELRSTVHTVCTPPADEPIGGSREIKTRERYSIPYFIAADRDKIIDCVPTCCGPDRPRRYDPISSRQYLDRRMNALY